MLSARWPFYGSRRTVVVELRTQSHEVSRKCAHRLMRGMAGPRSRRVRTPVALTRSTRSIRTCRAVSRSPGPTRFEAPTSARSGLLHLFAIMDWYSRKVLSWRLSDAIEVSFCVDCLEAALQLYGRPEVFNSDQRSQLGFKESSQHLFMVPRIVVHREFRLVSSW